MGRANRTRYVILGLLTDAPKSGYDIKREIEEVTDHFWRESFGQIYPTLKQLCEEGLARTVRSVDRGRGRTAYAITAAGRRELESWLEVEPEPGIIRHELLLKIFFGKHTDPGVLLAHVAAYRERLTRLNAYLADAEQSIRSEVPREDQPYWMLPVRSGQLVVAAGLAWAEEAGATLRNLPAARVRAKR